MATKFPLELNLPKHTYLALKQAASQSQKTEVEVALDAIQAYLANLSQIDPLLGLFVDDPDIIDHLELDIMNSREQSQLRLSGPNGS